MNIELVNRTVEQINQVIEHPKGWFGVCTLFFLIDHYIFSQWNFAIGFFLLFVIDTMVGTYCAWQQRKFSFQKFRQKLADKSLAYFTIIIGYSIATKIVLENGSESVIRFLDIPFYSLFVTVEMASIIRNWYEYKRWPFLRKILRHIEGYHDETGTEIIDSTSINSHKNGNSGTNKHLDDNAHPPGH
jgi:phage-related holin